MPNGEEEGQGDTGGGQNSSGDSKYGKLQRCVLIPYMVCTEWGMEKARACIKWVEEFFPVCVETGSEQSKTCLSWLPFPLSLVCYLWVLVTVIVCVAFVIVALLVCYLLAIIWLIICLVWLIILLIICPFRS